VPENAFSESSVPVGGMAAVDVGAPPPEKQDRVGPWDVVITCGGTGGHVLPALAVVDEIVALGIPRERIGFVGGRTGVEVTAVPAAGLDFVGFPVQGLERSLRPPALARNLRTVAGMGRAVWKARRLLRASGARVVVGMGGYASLACVFAAGRKRRVLTYESNSVPGIATKITGRRAVFIGTAFEATREYLPKAERIGFAVRPVFADLVDADGRPSQRRQELAAEARAAYGIEEGRQVLAVMGGSQGARSLNKAVLDLLIGWSRRDDLACVHLVGRRDYDEIARQTAGLFQGSSVQYVAIDFEEKAERVFALADVMVCRSGASTCAELAATGLPAVCVPYPYATDDHQRLNAEELVQAGAVELLLDAEVSGTALAAVLTPLLENTQMRETMARAASRLGEAQGARRLAEEIVAEIGRVGSST